MNKNKIKDILLIITLFIYIFFISYFKFANIDDIWNYGFSYNIATGLTIYNDFNMVITPLYPIIFGLIMKVFGTNIIVFYLFNALIPTSIFYIVYKYYKKSLLEIIIVITAIYSPNYNYLCILFLFILFILEDKKKNDYLIGIVLGLNFLTKSCMGLLSLASLYYVKDIKKIIKRIIGFLIPNIIITVYFIKENILYNYINYAFGSLLSFSKDNAEITIGIIIFISVIIYLIYKYKKTKDIKLLYILFFQIICYPTFNLSHIIFGLIPVIFYITYKNNNIIYNKFKKLLLILIITPIVLTIVQFKVMQLEYGTNALKYKLIKKYYLEDAKQIEKHIDNLENTYFIMYEAYYNKILLGLKINKYDLTLKGNLGYNGEEETIKYFDKQPSNTQFLIHKDFEYGQASKKIYDHIKNNYTFVKSFNGYELYINNK